jgi:hypothetical protein
MTADEIKVLSDSEMETGRSLAIGLGIVSIASLLIIGAFTAVVIPNHLLLVVLLMVVLGSAAATGVLFWAWRRRNQIIKAFTDLYLPAPKPAPTSTPAPALPAAPETKSADTQGASRGGHSRLIHGFEPATIMWLCDCIANGMPWTETQLEKQTVPHMQPPTPFGKSEVGNPYYRLFDATVPVGIFVRAGIITGRGGPGNLTGKLAIKSSLTMLELLKALPELDQTP